MKKKMKKKTPQKSRHQSANQLFFCSGESFTVTIICPKSFPLHSGRNNTTKKDKGKGKKKRGNKKLK